MLKKEESLMTRDISKKISTISLIAAIGVLYIHSYDATSYVQITYLSKAVAFFEKLVSLSLFGHSCVSLFFMISGFLFANGLNTNADWIRKIKSRIKSLGIPYLFWAFFGWSIIFFCSCIPIISSHMNMRATISISELYETFISIKYSHHLWYVQCLFIYCVMGIFLHYIGKSKIISAATISLLVILSLAGIEMGFFHTTRFAAFVIGFMMARWHPEFIEYSNQHLSKTAGVLLLLISIFISIINFPVFDRLCYFIFPVLMWFSFDCVRQSRIISMIEPASKHSFYIYCGHGTFMECIKQAFCLLGGNWIIMLSSYVLTPVITVTILLITLHIFKQIAPRFVSAVTGARS